MIPKKPAPDLIRGGYRFSDKIMLHKTPAARYRSCMSEDIRAGEIAVTLPDAFDAGIYFIGRIRTPWTRREDCPKNARGSDAVCTLELDARWAQALTDVESCSHLVVLY